MDGLRRGDELLNSWFSNYSGQQWAKAGIQAWALTGRKSRVDGLHGVFPLSSAEVTSDRAIAITRSPHNTRAFALVV